MTNSRYIGRELDLFANVRNWGQYWAQQVRPCPVGDVLAVGAGIGANSPLLATSTRARCVCLKPNADLTAQIRSNQDSAPVDRDYETFFGARSLLDDGPQFDTILGIDVHEHIETDRGELAGAASRLRTGGRIIVLSPAHQWLFAPFDAAIGHYRRYNRSMLRNLSPADLRLDKLIYLDSVSLTASLANRLMLRQSMPSPAQLQFWDRRLIQLSRVLDKVLGYGIGKSVLAIWR